MQVTINAAVAAQRTIQLELAVLQSGPPPELRVELFRAGEERPYGIDRFRENTSVVFSLPAAAGYALKLFQGSELVGEIDLPVTIE